ncbi:MAG: CvpA family protein [Bacteroidales bacterium]|jgi:membrane protein required for colicin V production|nr:CvpA family protein [Bacteroidales bacterium]
MLKIIDILIILPMIWFGYKGIKKGFIYEIFSILALLVGGWGSIYLSRFTETILGIETETGYLLSLGITFFACIIVVFLIGRLVKFGATLIIPEIFDKILGLIFGAFKILFFAGIVFYYITAVDTQEKVLTPNAKEKIMLYRPAYSSAKFLLPKIKTIHTTINKEKKSFDKQNMAD